MIPIPAQHPYRHENSPAQRSARRAENDSVNKDVRRFFLVPPFPAVRALLRSHGYRAFYFQRSKWRTHHAGEWVPFVCMRLSDPKEVCTRWIRAVPGPHLEMSDGAEVPNRQKLGWAVAYRKWRDRWDRQAPL